MEAVLFIGIQATGKSSFYLERFYRTHVRINGDMLKTKHRERVLLDACLAGKIAFVIDKMNLTRVDRATFIAKAKAAGFGVKGYFFETDIAAALKRNAARKPPERVPVPALMRARKVLEPPSSEEGFDSLSFVRMNTGGGFIVEPLHMTSKNLDPTQAAAEAQFSRQSDSYGKSHILADTSDISAALAGVERPADGLALDIATGGGHTALFLARHGWKVTAGDISERMLQNARKLAAEAGLRIETRMFPAEQVPFPDTSFHLVTSRVAPHHFSSPQLFVQEAARVLRAGGHFLLIDGTVPDDDPETEEWLHKVEKWRDPSHGRFLSRKTWEGLATSAGMRVIRSEINVRKQPDLEWYFDTAGTSPENRVKVAEAVRTATQQVRSALRLSEEGRKVTWWWPMLTLVGRKE